ncbi:acyl-phosphate glycerol 3-phosphate acyltransferase [Flavobacterium akiainvivens]|uniref:Acyl-phosphate glycerol 3-phosphate acyltransferase n=1 Tax=Flavobacterium akiainvivens TaxID=1202724 RepID=A0A0M8MAP1_9FLAO|nr:lysophospholipid acyltransferase family protein [Flavobacterium akiainvivens]KOS07133.1 acyl-phosphate glycerol 3-phosphate acyltransferase [Flavobacterium akiainvivens]SFQ75938.1 1-acyl-sn-glycerol-3-phosphate acyltransferase [Flavobacterium akiainvivens]
MKALKYILWALWRIWFYILMGVPIIALSPLLILTLSWDKTYPLFFKLARFWAKFILYGMGFYYRVVREQELQKGKSYMLVANHTSMTDIMLMLAITKNPFVFVGKKELAKIPIFGFFYRRSSILVDRSSSRSRFEVFEQAQKRLKLGLSVCIFPEGGVPEDETILLDEFKDGAFRLAIDHQIPIVPITFPDNKRRFSFTFFSGSPGIMRAKVHRFIPTAGLTQDDKKELKDKVREVILGQLEEYGVE